jgi:hypothetical protein
MNNRQLHSLFSCICCRWQWVRDSHLEYRLHAEWIGRVVWNLNGIV